MKTVLLPGKFLMFNISRKLGRPLALPISYTYSVTSKCDSRCKTCNIWKHVSDNDLTKEEWERIIKSIGNAPYWITITGGNQFLREDLAEIVGFIIRYNKPRIMNLPVSGSKPETTLEQTKDILRLLRGSSTTLIINLSIDGTRKVHDKVRGLPGSFEHALTTFHGLKALQKDFPQLLIGTYTVLSRFNAECFAETADFIERELKPDHCGVEIAERRKELYNTDLAFLPSKQDYLDAIADLQNRCTGDKRGIMKWKNDIRHRYYETVNKTLVTNSDVIKCYAGIASLQIASDGLVWQCCTRADAMGDLRQNEYDFRKVFYSQRANKVRAAIKKRRCYCTHSNPYYTNILSSFQWLK